MRCPSFKISIIFVVAALALAAAGTWWWLYHGAHKLELFNMPAQYSSSVVIQICMAKGSGGMERCALTQHKSLLAAGAASILVCRNETFISETAKKLGLPLVTCSPNRLSAGRIVFMPGVEAAIQKIIQNNKVLAIHCHYKREIFAAKKVAPHVPVVLTQHTPSNLASSVRATANGIVAVSQEIKLALSKQNEADGLKKSATIAVIPPFFDDERITSFIQATSQASGVALGKLERDVFFQTQFGVALKPCPLLVKIAHLYSNVQHKNHPLLFKAMRELIVNRHTPVQVALAGKGPMLATYQTMVRDLGIADYVHFLGSTELTPAVLHYADINLLASSEEALGIALIEGGLMRKPTIIAQGTGAADWLIVDKQTGFLFANNDVQSLADTIAYVLAHAAEAKACGNRLHDKVVDEFLPARSAEALLAFYQGL